MLCYLCLLEVDAVLSLSSRGRCCAIFVFLRYMLCYLCLLEVDAVLSLSSGGRCCAIFVFWR